MAVPRKETLVKGEGPEAIRGLLDPSEMPVLRVSVELTISGPVGALSGPMAVLSGPVGVLSGPAGALSAPADAE